MYRMGWTDERMDDFAKHTDQRFDAVNQRFDAVNQRFDAIDQRFDKFETDVNRRFDSVETRLDRLDDRFAALQRTLLIMSGGVIATLIAGVISLVVTQI
jgi:DNA anti-recombination protein RmuC